MKGIIGIRWNPILFLLAGLFLGNVLAGSILSSSGFTNCENNATITVNNANVQFDRSSLMVTFDVSGTSSAQQKVIADLTVSAYGNQVYQKTFNPCDASTFVGQLCPGRLPKLFCRIEVSPKLCSSSGGHLLCSWLSSHSNELRKPNPSHCILNSRFGWRSYFETHGCRWRAESCMYTVWCN